MHTSIRHYLSRNEQNLDTVGIHVGRSALSQDFPLHTHDYHETFIVVSGYGTHVLGTWECPLAPGDVFPIKGEDVHGFYQVQGLTVINLMYKPGFFQQPYSEIRTIAGFDSLFLAEPHLRLRHDSKPVLRLSPAALDYVVKMADFIIEQQQRNLPSLYPVLRMQFMALVSFLATQYDVHASPSAQMSVISQALAYMEAHLAQPLQLQDIADQVFLSPRQLERLFRACYDTSPMKYLQKMRLSNAMTLLTSQQESVTTAARKSGFEDVSYFTRVFRATYGMTPSQAKKQFERA